MLIGVALKRNPELANIRKTKLLREMIRTRRVDARAVRPRCDGEAALSAVSSDGMVWRLYADHGRKQEPAATTTETHRRRRARYDAPNSALARRAKDGRG
jgi:hypothetical protein